MKTQTLVIAVVERDTETGATKTVTTEVDMATVNQAVNGHRAAIIVTAVEETIRKFYL